MITQEMLEAALPKGLARGIDQGTLVTINQVLSDPELFEFYRENLLSYGRVLQDGRYKLSDYVYAIKYVSHKLMGDSNKAAWAKVFPQRYQALVARGAEDKEIAAHVTAYNKNKLVNAIMEQTLIPSWILNQDLYQKALNTQAELMISAKSEKVRCDAANSLLTHLKMPEVAKVQLDVNVKENSAIDALRQATMELVARQKAAVASGGMTATGVAEMKIIQAEVIDAP